MAYKQLQVEGYIDGRVSSGTFVASKPFAGPEVPVYQRPHSSVGRSRAHVATRAQASLHGVQTLPGTHRIGKAFRCYEPALDLFPVELWARVASRVYRHAPRWLYGNGSAGGYQPLRRVIAEYLGSARGVHCSPEQIIVTCGAQQALYLVARLLLDPGDAVWMEDPGYPGASGVFQAAGASIIPVPVDAEGIDVKAGHRLAPRAKLAYVTPANQFPLGVTMSAGRRMDLLRWASHAGAWVIDDDYDSEYRYSERPVASLQSIDSFNTVIYVGTFTKMLFNALRIGFVVLPEELVSVFEAARNFMDRHPPTLDQAILAEFITEGHFGHHVQKMRQLYTHRQETLREACAQYVGDLMTLSRADTGVKTIGWLPPGYSDVAVANRAQALGLEVLGVSTFSVRQQVAPGLILGFGGCDDAELHRGAKILAQAISSPLRKFGSSDLIA
jgi:GntR family transcriptional regulator / MocR family aminotransferase